MHCEATLQIALDHPAFAGHFPGAPIVPGVLLLDAAVHAATQALRSSCSEGKTNPICQIGSAKFLAPVGPGTTLAIRCTGTATGSVRFDISSGSLRVSTGTLMFPSAP